MNIHTLYAQAHEELRQLSVQLARMAEQMSSSKHLHPLDKPLPFLSDYAERLATAQRLITKYYTLLELGIESSSGASTTATLTRLLAAPNQGPTGDIGPEIPALEVTPPSEVKPDMPGWLK